MNKKLTVKQKHRYTQQSTSLYSGEANYKKTTHSTKISFIEDESASKVTLEVFDKEAILKRIGKELQTTLTFRNKEHTNGCIITNYGTIEVQVYTYKYIVKNDCIAIEYDILVNEEVSDGYRMIWNMKEGLHESN